MYSSPNSWIQVERDPYTTWRSFTYLLTSSLRTFIKEKALRRFSPRLPKQIECELISGQRIFKGTTENVSSAGLSVSLTTDEILPNEVTVQLYRDDRVLTEHPWRNYPPCTKVRGNEVVYGIRFLEPKNLDLSSLDTNLF